MNEKITKREAEFFMSLCIDGVQEGSFFNAPMRELVYIYSVNVDNSEKPLNEYFPDFLRKIADRLDEGKS